MKLAWLAAGLQITASVIGRGRWDKTAEGQPAVQMVKNGWTDSWQTAKAVKLAWLAAGRSVTSVIWRGRWDKIADAQPAAQMVKSGWMQS